MDRLKKTRETYKKIAQSYAETWQDRSIILPHMERFVSLVRPGGLVFDVGCGPGFDTAVLQQHHHHAIGLDYTWQMMVTGRTQHQLTVDFAQADMRRLPLGTIADGLWVSASLLHIPRPEVSHTLREFHRVLLPQGVLYLAVKKGDGELWTAQSYGHDAPRFFTLWQPQSLDELLKTAAFEIIDGWVDNISPTPWIVRFARKTSHTPNTI